MPLIIKDKIIDHISGPVSFSLLKPKTSFSLPNIILFGDAHFSTKGMCECKQDGCYNVYDKSFLQILDSISTDENPVDFNTEAWFLDYQRKQAKIEEQFLKYVKIAEENKYSIQMLREKIMLCYVKELKESEIWNKYSPTRLMRYHYVDTRLSNAYSLEYLIHHIESKPHPTEIDPLSLSNLYSYKKLHPKVVENCICKLKNKYGIFYFKILKFQYFLTFNLEKAIELFFEIATPENSLIMKQYKKFPERLKDIEMWKNVFFKYYKHIFDTDPDLTSEVLLARKHFYKTLLEDNLDNIINMTTNDELSNLLLKTPYGTLSSMYLDLYYLFRMLKRIEEKDCSRLSIGYFGDLHIVNLKYLLTTILDFYTVVHELNSQEDITDTHSFNRCLKFPNINFSDYI
jgi:hypothetical protein